MVFSSVLRGMLVRPRCFNHIRQIWPIGKLLERCWHAVDQYGLQNRLSKMQTLSLCKLELIIEETIVRFLKQARNLGRGVPGHRHSANFIDENFPLQRAELI